MKEIKDSGLRGRGGAGFPTGLKWSFMPTDDRKDDRYMYIYMYIVYVLGNVIKMENSLLVIFDEIWPKTMYYSTGSLTRFWSNFKIFLKIQT